MPTGPGGLDAEGVYLFGEADVEGAHASDLLNLLGESVSTQLADDRARLTTLEDRLTTVARRRVIAVTNSFTTTAWADFPQAGDAAALAFDFTKVAASTKLIVTLHATAQLSGGSDQWGEFGVRIDVTDYAVARRRLVSGQRGSFAGEVEISGLAAGVYAVKPRFRTALSSTNFQLFNADDSISYSVQESF